MRNSFDPDMVRALAAILDETGLTEIEVTDKENRIRVVRAAPAAMVHAAVPAPVSAPVAVATVPVVEAAPSGDAVNSPMVGIAYLSPEPGAPPYVVPGQQVSAGQTLLLIEAMKTFNQVKAPRTGTVTRILITGGAPVEYGEPLMIIE